MAGLILDVKNLQDYNAQINKLSGFLTDINRISGQIEKTISGLEKTMGSTSLGLSLRIDPSKLKINEKEITQSIDASLSRGFESGDFTRSARSLASNLKTTIESEIRKQNIGGSVSEETFRQASSALDTRELGKKLVGQAGYISGPLFPEGRTLDQTKVPSIIETLKKANPEKDLDQISEMIIRGLNNGFITHRGKTLEAATQLVTDLIKRVQDELGIASPSKKFMEIARFAILGFTEGLDQNDPANQAAKRMAEEALRAVETTLKTHSPSEAIKEVVLDEYIEKTYGNINLNDLKGILSDAERISVYANNISLTPIETFLTKLKNVFDKVELLSRGGRDNFSKLSTALTQMLTAIEELENYNIKLPPMSNSGYDPLLKFIQNIQHIQDALTTIKFNPQTNANFQEFASSLRSFELAVRKMFEFDMGLTDKGHSFKASLLILQENIGALVDMPLLKTLANNTEAQKGIAAFKKLGDSLQTLKSNNIGLESITTSIEKLPLTPSLFIKAQGLRFLFNSLSQALSNFDLIKTPNNMEMVGKFLYRLPDILLTLVNIPIDRTLESTKAMLSLLPVLSLIGIGARQLSELPTDLAQRLESLKQLFYFIDDLGTFGRNIQGGFDSSFQNILHTLARSIPVLVVIGVALKPFSTLNAGSLDSASQLLPAIFQFITQFNLLNSIDFKIDLGFYTRLLKILPMFYILAKGLSVFNNVKIVQNEGIGDLGLGVKRLVEAAAGLENIVRLNVFTNFGIVRNVKKVFTALKEGVNVLNEVKIDNNKLLSISRLLDNVAKSIEKYESTTDFSKLFKELSSTLQEDAGLTNKTGVFVANAILRGLTSQTEKFVEWGISIGTSIADGFKRTLGIASPSKLFYQYGLNIVAGLTGGLGNLTSIGVNIGNSFVSGFSNALKNLTTLYQQTGQNLRSAGQSFFTTGLTTAGTGGLAGYIQSQRIGMVAEFDQTLKMIDTFGATTDAQLAQIESQVLQFSADTIFNPQQSAAAFLELQKAGLDVTESQLALSNVGNLAAASQISLELATRGVLSASQIFNISMDESARLANVYTQAANLSTASADELIQGMGNVGPIAAQFGLSFEETVAILAKFNDSGIRGAEAGTQLKSMLTNLTRPVEEVKAAFTSLGVSLSDETGQFKGLDQILNELRSSLFDTKIVTQNITQGLTGDQKTLAEAASKQFENAQTKIMMLESGLTSLSEKQRQALYDQRARAEQVLAGLPDGEKVIGTITTEITRSQAQNFEALQTLAGTYGQAGLAILLGDDENALQSFIAEMEQLPTAAETSATMMDTFKGALDSLRGSIDTLIIKALRPLMNAVLKPLLEIAISVVNGFIALPAPVLAFVAGLGLFATVITTLTGVGMILLGAVLVPMGFAFTTLSVLVTSLSAVLFNPLGLVAGFVALSGGIVALTSLIVILGGALTGFTALLGIYFTEMMKNDKVVASFKELGETVSSLFSSLSTTGSAVLNLVTTFYNSGSSIASNFDPVVKVLDRVQERIQKIVEGIQGVGTFAGLLTDAQNIQSGTQTTNIGNAQQNLLQAQQSVANVEAQNQFALMSGEGPLFQTTTQAEKYMVAAGDTLWGIAQSSNMTVAELRQLNPILGENQHIIQVGQELILSNQQTVATGSQEYLDALAAQDKAQQELNRAIAQENQYRQWAAKGGEVYYTEQERRVNNLQTRIKEFGQTSFGNRLFDFLGVDENNIDFFFAIVNRISSLFTVLSNQVNTFKVTLIDVFSGKASLSELFTSFTQPIGTLTYLFETLTGINISDVFQTALSTGNFKPLIKQFATQIVNTLFDAFNSIGLTIFESLGLSFKNIENIFNTLNRYINFLITGTLSFSEIVKNIFYDLGLEKVYHAINGVYAIFRTFVNLIVTFFNSSDTQKGANLLQSMFDRLKPVFEFLNNSLDSLLNYLGSFSGLTDIEVISKLESDINNLMSVVTNLPGLRQILDVVDFIIGRFYALSSYLRGEEFYYIKYLFEQIGIIALKLIGFLAVLRVGFYILFTEATVFWNIIFRISQLLQILGVNTGRLGYLFTNSFKILGTLGTQFQWLGGILSKFAAVLTLITFLYGSIQGVFQLLAGLGQMLKGFNTGNWDMFYEGLARFGTGGILALVGGIKAVIQGLIQIPILIANILGLETVEERLRNVVPLLEMFMEILNNPQLFKVLGSGLRSFFDSLKLIPEIIKAYFANKTFSEIGKDIIKGLWEGIKFSMYTLPNLIIGAIRDFLVLPVMRWLGIASPSKRFMEIGVQIVRGLIVGILSLAGQLPSLLVGIFNSAVNTLGSVVGFLSNLLPDPVSLIGTFATGITNALNSLLDFIGLPDLSSIGTSILNSIFSFLGLSEGEQSASIEYFTTVKDRVVSGISTAFSQLMSGDFLGAATTLVTTLGGAFGAITNWAESLNLIDRIKSGVITAVSSAALLLSDGSLQNGAGAIIGAIAGALGALFSTGTDAATSLGSSILEFIATGITTAITTSFSLITAGQQLASSLLGGLASGLGSMVDWVSLNIVDPLVAALSAAGSTITGAIDNVLPNEVNIELGSVTIPNVTDIPGMAAYAAGLGQMPTLSANLGGFSIDLPDNPFASALGLAMGGRVKAGGVNEILEERRNVPFEVLSMGKKNYLLANEPGVMRSPLASGQYGLGGGTTYQVREGDIVVNVNNPGASVEDIRTAVQTTIRQERMNNPIDMRLRKQGF